MDTELKCTSCQKPLPPNAPKGLCPECLMKAGFDTAVGPEAGKPSRSPAFEPPSIAEVAKLFPQFEILELLGQGGMGAGLQSAATGSGSAGRAEDLAAAG